MAEKVNNPTFIERVNTALFAFSSEKYYIQFESWFEPLSNYYADLVRKTGHKDYMDCWIIGTAIANHYNLVSEDTQFQKIFELLEWDDSCLFNWSDFLKEL